MVALLSRHCEHSRGHCSNPVAQQVPAQPGQEKEMLWHVTFKGTGCFMYVSNVLLLLHAHSGHCSGQ